MKEAHEYIWNKRMGYPKPPPGAISVDRNTRFGNPFIIGPDGDRETVCDKFDEWLDTGNNFGNPKATEARRIWILDNIRYLKNLNLLCWCAPDRCHAETYARRANGLPPRTKKLLQMKTQT